MTEVTEPVVAVLVTGRQYHNANLSRTAAALKSGKWLKLNVAIPPVSLVFGHVESSRLVPRGAHSSPIKIQQKQIFEGERVLKANIRK
jgi:hypothetical protein